MAITREGCDECFPVIVSSKACQYCGRRAILTREEVERHLLEYTWMHYAVSKALKSKPWRARKWLRTTLPKDHPNYVDPKDLGYQMWYWLSSLKRTIAVQVEERRVIHGPPSARWAFGKPLEDLERWMIRQGGFRKETL